MLHVLIPPPHESAESFHLSFPNIYFIYGIVGNVHPNTVLPPLNVLSDGTQTCHFQGSFYWLPFPPNIPSTLICLSCNSYGHPMMKILCNYQHRFRHHPTLTHIQCNTYQESQQNYKLD